MNYYAISDIHGYLDVLKDTLKLIDLNKDNKLIMLGDYIDYGNKSYDVLLFIKNLQEKYGEKIIILRGNHEELFLEWLSSPIDFVNYFSEDIELVTVKSFLNSKQIETVLNYIRKNKIELASSYAANIIKKEYSDLIVWLRKLPYYYETDKQIYVHAGINEESNDLWKLGTSNEMYVMKYPIEEGNFYKDIIAGHIGTASIRKNDDYSIYWDKKSHFYIDGSITKNKTIPVLKYNVDTDKYSSFYKNGGSFIEYLIK